MTQQHPITPPPELVQQWASESLATQNLCTRAAQWGADQELEACCDYLRSEIGPLEAARFRAVRRPKPASLKEQALKELESLRCDAKSMGMGFDAPAIRRALEQLPDQ